MEFVDQLSSAVSSAFRPQEALVPHEVDQSIRQMNRFADSPVAQGDGTKARMSHTILTGDLADSQQLNETEWVQTLLDGGMLSPNSGTNAPNVDPLCPKEGPTPKYTGVQDYDDYGLIPPSATFYDPDDPGSYANGQFPNYPGLLDRAQQPFQTPGLAFPSYVAIGNHDALIQGNQAAFAPFERVATGCVKGITGPPPFARSASTRNAGREIARRGMVDGLPPFGKALRALDRPRASAAAAPWVPRWSRRTNAAGTSIASSTSRSSRAAPSPTATDSTWWTPLRTRHRATARLTTRSRPGPGCASSRWTRCPRAV